MSVRPSEPPKHVLFVLDYFWPHVGGGETSFWELARALAAAGTRVSVVTMQTADTPRRECVAGVEIHRVCVPRWAARAWFAILAIPLVWRLARDAEVIHAALYAAALPASCAAALRRKPLVLTVHEVFGPQWQQMAGKATWGAWFCRLCERLLLRLPADRYVAVSRYTAGRLRQFSGLPASKITTIYNAIDGQFWQPGRHAPRDPRGEHGWAADTFVYLFFGRPGITKGVEDLLRAAAEVRSKRPQSRLVLLLGREPRAGYERAVRLMRQLKLDDYVLLVDPVPLADLPGYLLAADCVVVPSWSEGFGYAALEARMLGCRVLATRGHAVEEVLGQEVELYPAGDVAALAERLAGMERLRQPLPAPARRYPVASQLQAMRELYGQLARGR